MTVIWYRPDGSASVVEDAERYDGMLDDGFPQSARGLEEIARFLGDDFQVVKREHDHLFLDLHGERAGFTEFQVTARSWLAPHKDGGILVFDEKEIDDA